MNLKIATFAALLVGASMPALAQMPPPGSPFGGPDAVNLPPELRRIEKAQEQLMKETDPELYKFQDKQRAVQAQIAQAVERMSKGEIDKDKAKAEIVPLIRQRQELMNAPDFLAEQELAGALFSTPEFRKKMDAIMRRYAPKPAAPAKAARPGKAL